MQPEKCAKCLMPKSAQSGSLTQWITLCSCERVSPSAVSENEVTPHCKHCGKPIRKQRSGSLTQWIFQRDSCSCQLPDSPSTVPVGAVLENIDAEKLNELEIDAARFPLDRYIPEKILGEGATGTVVLSHDRTLQKRVAVKVLKTLDREALLAFQNEARTTSKLTHPHIVKVLDFGITNGGVPFMVMELVEGISLELYLQDQGKLDLIQSIALFTQLSEALAYAHSLGVLHRDLKPSNILIVETEEGLNAFLIDFGVAKLQTFYQSATIYNGTPLIGTPAYMSPDKALGREFDERSDLYSLACVMFETLTARPVFRAETPLEFVNLHAKKLPPRVLDYIAETPISAALSKIIEDCLCKDPDKRLQSANHLKVALQAIPIDDSPEELNQQSSDFKRAQQSVAKTDVFARKPLFLPGLALLMLTSAFVFYTMWSSKHESESLKAESAKPKEIIAPMAALGSINDDERVHSRPDHPMPKIKSISLISETDIGIEHLATDYPNLEKLEIVDSKISPESFRYLKKLPIALLRLENLTLTRQHIHEISQLSSVVNLNFATENEIDLSALGELKKLNLKLLKFSDLHMTQQAINEISTIENLGSLGMINSQGFADIDLSPLSKLKKLVCLDLRSSDISDDTLKSLPQTSTVMLVINYTNVTNNILPILAKAKSLRDIYISESPTIDKNLLKKFEKETGKHVILNNPAVHKDVEKRMAE